MIRQCRMAILAGIVNAAARHFDRDDVERGAVMDASSFRIHLHASNLGSCWLHMTIKTQKGKGAMRVYMSGQNALAFSLLRENGKGGALTMTSVSQPELEKLLEVARKTAENSYSPYSEFRVGAALRLTNGETVTGTNVENVSYGLTICAERAAVVRAVSQFGPKIRIAAVAVVNLNGKASPPCGACRQVLAEFTEPGAPVIFPIENGTRTMAFNELLPLGTEMKLK
jgi:homotetrameric cytidine deaminase